MKSPDTSIPPAGGGPRRRQGTTLVVTMIVIAAVASILAVSSEQMLGMHMLNGSHLTTQTNAYAAEACAGMVEGFLENATNNDPALVQDIAPSAATVAAAPAGTYDLTGMKATWNNYAGYTGGVLPLNPALAPTGSWPNMWIGNCMVTWRIEPITVYDTTYGAINNGSGWSAITPPSSGNTTVNYNALLPTSGSVGTTLNNPGFFQYRMTVTSYYVDLKVMANKYGQTMANATPWSNPGEALSTIQVQREIQLHLLNLFQYVIFYAAVGPTGDIEFHPGGALTIGGAVHSNGAIYFGGNGMNSTQNFHAIACQGAQITVGTTASPVGIDAPGGIYRQQKDANVYFATALGIPAVLNPANVPMRNASVGGVAMSGNNDLNGDTDAASMTIVKLNGQQLISTNDSRSGLTVGNGSKYIRDSASGSGVVSLSNFPSLKGYAFEPQGCVPSADTGTPIPLYYKGLAAGGQPQTWNPYELTINTGLYPNAQQLYYSGPSTLMTTTPTSYPIYATDMPLWSMAVPGSTTGATYQDVWPSGKYYPGSGNFVVEPGSSTPYWAFSCPGGTLTQPYWPKISINKGYISPAAKPGVPSTLDTYLPEVVKPVTGLYGQPVEGHYLALALHGASGTATTGLTIRERGAPNLLFTFDLVEHPPALLPGSPPQQGHLIMSDTPPFWCVPDCTGAIGNALPDPNQLYGAEWLNAYAAMMKSRYAVFLGADSNGNPFDITIPFFNFGLGSGGMSPHAWNTVGGNTCNVQYFNFTALESIWTGFSTWNQQTHWATGLLATSDLFCNPREGAWLEVNHYLNSTSTPTPAGYQVDALTLNIGQICQFIQNTTWSTVSTNAQQTTAALPLPGTPLSSLFNGVIYAHRTHRTMVPWANGAGALPYAGVPKPNNFPASDGLTGSLGVNPPSPPPSASTPLGQGSKQGAAGATIGATYDGSVYSHPITYPCLNGYTTAFMTGSLATYQDNTPGVADHMLPIYDPLEPQGYSPTENSFVNTGWYKTPACLPSSMNQGNSTSVPYPVFGTTTLTNGGVVGVGTGALPARPGMPNVWSVYPSALAVRLYNASAINWGGVQVSANNRPQGLTVITPNSCYLWGDYNTTQFADASGTLQITPCGVFCDGLTTLSNAWSDVAGATATYTGGIKNSTSTSYIVSVMINNQPTDYENTKSEGSDGTHCVIRYAENWGTGGSGGGASTWTFQGSLVVLNRTRYGRSYVPKYTLTSFVSPFILNGVSSYASCTANSFYGVPFRNYQFNSDLLTQAGQPPAAPHGITVQRVVSTINLNNN